MDGTYISVKGYPEKIPFIYAVDYLSHDLLHGILAPSENYQAFYKLLSELKRVGYYPHAIICDDQGALQAAQEDVFPDAQIQLCQKHFLTNLKEKHDPGTYQKLRAKILHPYPIPTGFDQRLFSYKFFLDCPKTNNLIELFNSHLKGRLKTVKGFSSFVSAKRFLNAWMVHRRLKNFTSCCKKFSYLNGCCSLEFRLRHGKTIEEVRRLLP